MDFNPTHFCLALSNSPSFLNQHFKTFTVNNTEDKDRTEKKKTTRQKKSSFFWGLSCARAWMALTRPACTRARECLGCGESRQISLHAGVAARSPSSLRQAPLARKKIRSKASACADCSEVPAGAALSRLINIQSRLFRHTVLEGPSAVSPPGRGFALIGEK